MIDKKHCEITEKSYWLFIFDYIQIIFCDILSIAAYELYFFCKKRLATDVPVRAFSINDIFYSASNINQSK